MNYSVLMASVGGLAIGNSIFYGIYLWNVSSRNSRSNRILALLLFALAIRIGKSLTALMFPEISAVLTSIGVVAMAFIGPLLWLYIRSLTSGDFRLVPTTYLHFIIPAITGLTVGFVGDAEVYLFYQVVITQCLLYLGLSFLELQKLKSANQSLKWSRILLGATFLIWLTFMVQLLTDFKAYYVGATAFAVVVVYCLAYLGMRHYKGVLNGHKRKSKLGDARIQALKTEILRLIHQEKLFLEPDLTINKLASVMGEQPYLVSQCVNEGFGMSLPELLSDLRVKEACKLIKTNSHLSIEAIAYDSGFNSLSAFYTAFKKIKGVTPATYRAS